MAIIHCFVIIPTCLMSADWWLTRNAVPKINFFFEKKGNWPLWHLQSGQLADIMSCYEDIAKFSLGDVMEWMSISIKYVNLYYFYFIIFMSYGTETILIPLTSLKLFIYKVHFILSIWPGCTEPPQWTRCNPSLANEVCLVMVRHPGTSFTVNHPQEAVPKSTNDRLSPSLSWSSLFWDLYKQGST